MYINIKVIVSMDNSRSMHFGSCEVLNSDYKKDPDWTAACAAYNLIRDIKFKTGYRDNTKIVEVIYDGDKDITELTKKVRPVIQDNLPF